MIYQDPVGNCLVADSVDDVLRDGWRVLLNEPWKKDVARLHVTRGGAGTLREEFALIFVSIKETDDVVERAESYIADPTVAADTADIIRGLLTKLKLQERT